MHRTCTVCMSTTCLPRRRQWPWFCNKPHRLSLRETSAFSLLTFYKHRTLKRYTGHSRLQCAKMLTYINYIMLLLCYNFNVSTHFFLVATKVPIIVNLTYIYDVLEFKIEKESKVENIGPTKLGGILLSINMKFSCSRHFFLILSVCKLCINLPSLQYYKFVRPFNILQTFLEREIQR